MKIISLTKPLIVWLVLALLIPYRAHSGVPTIDPANIVQTTISAVKNVQQVAQLYDQIDNQVRQIGNQVKAFNNTNGDYFKDQLLNALADKKARRWMPETYSQMLDLYKSIEVRDEYADGVNAAWDARDSLKVTNLDVLFPDIDSDSAQRWQQHENDSMAAVGVAEKSFERVSQALDETEALIDDIPNSTDSKAAQDLQNRMQGQTQILLAELIRVQSTQAATNGRKQLFEHAMKGEDKKRAQVTELPSIL